jgi:hypothetical protein
MAAVRMTSTDPLVVWPEGKASDDSGTPDYQLSRWSRAVEDDLEDGDQAGSRRQRAE